MRMALDPHTRKPIYLQIIEHIQRESSLGRVRPGAQLPTVRELAHQLGVNFNTVARAYRRLARIGLVTAQPGRGTFVLPESASRKPGIAALDRLAAEYVAHARRLHFTDAQIAGAVSDSLASGRLPNPPGDSYE